VSLADLRIFNEIAITGSMSKGAANCGVSQSAASQRIQEAEKRLGVTLLDRTKRPLELTTAGLIYADFCRDALRREDEFRVQLENLKGDVEGTARVASIYSIGLSEMSHLRDEFAVRYPKAHLAVEYMRPANIYAAVRNGGVDLGLVSYPESSREIEAIPWRREKMQLAVWPSHPLASREEVHLSDLDGIAFIAFDEDLSIRRELDRFLRANGVTVDVVMHFDNIQTIKEAVALGSGVSILPARTMQTEIEQGRLVAIPLHAPDLARPVGIVRRRRKKLHRAAEAFLELVGVEGSR
jgi:DNA-binding transcriptional LysR family regulator